jgi:hypothetical protein
VLFYNCYELPTSLPVIDKEIICPLNTEDDIAGVCEWCRRCFDGQAVSHAHRTRKIRTRTQLSQSQLRRREDVHGQPDATKRSKNGRRT